MFTRLRNCLAALALAGAAFSASAHDGPLDPRFGDGGMRNYGFQSFNGSGREDRAGVACAGPDGTLVVTGAASDARRIVTMRLLPNGDYDPAFGGGDGRESVELAMTPAYFMAGLCLPGNRILLARRLIVDGNNEMNIQLIRLDAATGLLDPQFGQNGVALLDVDTWQGGLQTQESPLSLSPLDNGEVLMAGSVTAANRFVAFAARVAADGRVAQARVYVDAANRATANTLMTAELASDGSIWAIVEGKQPGSARVTPFRVRLDRQTLEWIDVPDALPALEGSSVYAGRGVRVREDVLAVPLIEDVAGANPVRGLPGLMVYRASGKTFIPLPAPNLPGEDLTLTGVFGLQSALVLPGNRVLVSSALTRPGENIARGMYLAVVHIGGTAGQDRIDTGFGVAGAQTAVFRPTGGTCGSGIVRQDFSAATLWAGTPVLVGNADATCSNDGGGFDYLVARIGMDAIFADGFD